MRALAAHPGYSSTGLQGHDANAARRLALWVGNRVIATDSRTGTLPTLYAATQDLPGASFVGPGGLGEMRGGPALVGRSSEASDPEAAKKLWTLSEELTGVTFPTLNRPNQAVPAQH